MFFFLKLNILYLLLAAIPSAIFPNFISIKLHYNIISFTFVTVIIMYN